MSNWSAQKFLRLEITASRVAFLLVLALLLMFSVTPRGYAQDATTAPVSYPFKRTFVVSSYYSPLPGQKYYFRGTYDADVRLNGEGVHAADGTKVYPGMAAASREFPFGTKMEIPGFGVVAVHDRGGAIKGNRIDIWMGEGEEGLSRALGWGMRTLQVTVYGPGSDIQEKVVFEGIPSANLERFLVQTKHFKEDFSHDDEGAGVRDLQRILKKIGYLNTEVSGYFGDETLEAVKRFQLDQKIITGASDPAAGNFGPKTRVALEEFLNAKQSALREKMPAATLKRGDHGEASKHLNEVLDYFGYAAGTGAKDASRLLFDDATAVALIKFQIDAGVIADAKGYGAGLFGPKSEAALSKLIENAFFEEAPRNLRPSSSGSNEAAYFTQELSLGSSGAEVALLQEELRRLNFLRVPETGFYGKVTEHAVFKFQQSFRIVQRENDVGAGVVGPKTMEKLNEIARTRGEEQRAIVKTTEKKELVAARVEEEKILIVGISEIGSFGQDLVYGTRGNQVEKLQAVLKRLGFFPGIITTEYFGDITKRSLLAFQESHGLEKSGVADLSTRKVLNELMTTSQSSS